MVPRAPKKGQGRCANTVPRIFAQIGSREGQDEERRKPRARDHARAHQGSVWYPVPRKRVKGGARTPCPGSSLRSEAARARTRSAESLGHGITRERIKVAYGTPCPEKGSREVREHRAQDLRSDRKPRGPGRGAPKA